MQNHRPKFVCTCWSVSQMFRNISNSCSKFQIAPAPKLQQAQKHAELLFQKFSRIWPMRLSTCRLGNGRCALCAPFFVVEAKLRHMLVHVPFVDVFGQHVRRVFRAEALLQSEIALPDAILHPQIGSG